MIEAHKPAARRSVGWILARLRRRGLVPKMIGALRDYDRHKGFADLTAGLTVGLVALPLAMAFAISSGLTPQAGIYTAVVAGLRALEELAEAMRRAGRHLLLCGARHQPADLIARADFHRHVGDENICAHIQDALQRARDIHQQEQQAGHPSPVMTQLSAGRRQ